MEYIRKITTTDKPQVLTICETIWEGEDYIPRVFDTWVAESNNYFVGLFEEAKLLGFGRLVDQGYGNFWLEGLRKDKSLKIKGVGKKIADYLIKIALEKECKSLKFSTYFDNIQSITIHEKMGFTKIKEWSFLEIQKESFAKDLPLNSQHSIHEATCDQFIDFIKESKFLSEMNNYLCEAWKVYNLNDEYLKDLYARTKNFAIIQAGNLEALLSTIADNEGNLFIIFLDYRTEEQCHQLLQKSYQQAMEEDYPSINIIVPSHERVDLLNSFGFKSWEQKDDFFLYEYRGK